MRKILVAVFALSAAFMSGPVLAQSGGRWVIIADQSPPSEESRKRNAEAVAKAAVANAAADAERARKQAAYDAEVAKRSAAIQQQNAMAAHRSAEAQRIGQMATDAWKARMKAIGCDVDAPAKSGPACVVGF